MSYDFETDDHSPPQMPEGPPQNPKDLEVIVMLLTLGAIILTPQPDTEFTFEQLFREAQEIGGPLLPLDERDVRIVLANAKFLKKLPGNRYKMR